VCTCVYVCSSLIVRAHVCTCALVLMWVQVLLSDVLSELPGLAKLLQVSIKLSLIHFFIKC